MQRLWFTKILSFSFFLDKRKGLLFFVFMLVFFNSGTPAFAEPWNYTPPQRKAGNLFAYWGWNRAVFTHSTISFSGENYQFTLYKVKAADIPIPFRPKPFLNPATITIPQYNFRVGIFIKDNWYLSFSDDHMKYKMNQDQTVKMKGYIDQSGTAYDGIYSGQQVQLTSNFLTFEHTNGLNYLNVSTGKYKTLYTPGKKWDISAMGGGGMGILYPKTNTQLLNYRRHDEFHIAGMGVSSEAAICVTWGNRVFVQSEIKGGWIFMPDIQTTYGSADRARQQFGFLQGNIVFGVWIPRPW
jgi:hypothetical protein